MCTRKSPDPLVRAFLDRYGLNLLSIPRKNVMCGDLYVASGALVSTPGSLSRLLVPAPVLPAPVTGEELADLTGVVSKAVSGDLGFGVLKNFLSALGALGLMSSLKAAYQSNNTSAIHFRFRDATRDYVDPMALGTAIKHSRFDRTHPFVADDNNYFLVAGVVRTPSISIVAEDARENAVNIDVGALKLAAANAGVDLKHTATGEVTYAGQEKLAIGVELYELVHDKEQDRLLLKIPKKPPRTLRGSRQRAVPPAFIGGRDGNAFITLE